MYQPEELKSSERLVWSGGRGTDVWALFTACIAGELAMVRQLVEHDPELVHCHYAYRTPLYFAVRENQIEIVSFLLSRGADPLSLGVNDSLLEICRDRGYAGLERLLEERLARDQHVSSYGEDIADAIRSHDGDRMRSLLDSNPALLNCGDRRSNQPVHWAVMTRQPDIVDDLLNRGADIDAARFDGARPIQLTNGDYHFRGWRDVAKDWPTPPAQMLDHLLKRGAYFDICTACQVGAADRVRELLDLDPTLANRVSDYVSYYAGSGTPLRNAAAGGHIDVVRLLLEHGADPNLPEKGIAPRGHALYAAVANRHLDSTLLLLEHGAFANPEVESSADALSRAISNADQPMIELLCSHGAARSVDLLAYYGDVRTAAAVFAANPARADDPDALANAASEGHEAVVRLMLRYEPDLPKKLVFPGWSPAAKTKELAELLFQHGMDPNRANWLGVTPLHEFSRNGDLENARLVLDHGADLHARDDDICSTPLGWAAKFGQQTMVELLLQRGARPTSPDDPPWATPLAWAMRRKHFGIAEILRQRGSPHGH